MRALQPPLRAAPPRRNRLRLPLGPVTEVRGNPARGRAGKRSGLVAAIVVAFVVAPLLAIPLYLLGGRIADALDHDGSNGVFALELVLGVGGPGVLALLVAWRRASVPVAVALAVASTALSLAILFVAFLIYCSAADCVV